MTQTAESTLVHSSHTPQVEGGLDLLAITWRRKWIALSITFVALALGYLYFLQAAPLYQSEAQILLIKKQADLPVGGAKGQVNYEDELSTHMILIRSPLIVEQAVQEHDLASLPSFRSRKNVAAAIIGGLSTKRGGDRQAPDPNVIQLTYQGPDPEDCARVLTAIIASYQDFLGATYQDFSKETVQLISRAKDELHKQLTEKETAYRQFRQESPLLWKGEEGGNLHEMRMAEIENARSAVLVENSQLQARIEAIETALKQGGNREALMLLVASDESSGSPRSLRHPRNALDERMLTILLEEQMLLEEYGRDHPKVRAIRKKMQLMREHLGGIPLPENEEDAPVDFLTLYLQALNQELKLGEEKLRGLDELFEKEREAAKALASFQLSDETYRNEIARTQQLFDGVVKRLQEMNLIQDYGGVSAQAISPPGRGSLVKPRLSQILLIFGFLGLCGGFGLGYLVELADRSFRSPEDIHQQLGLPLVGHIPVIGISQGKGNGISNNEVKAPLDPVLCTFHRPKSREAEAYRALRTCLYYSALGEGHKAIQITSASPSDGKTTLASNLAVCLANSGKKVAIVDADFRRPKVHKLFGLDSAIGFSSLIAGDRELAEVTQPTAVDNLWLIACGPKPHNPADLLTSPRLQQALDMLKEAYEFVIVDSPPLLAVTDPSVMAPRVDAVLLVMRLNKSARHALTRSAEMLRSLGAEILGIVVNGVGKKSGYGGYYRYGGYRYGGYRYGGYHYGYGYDYGYGPGGRNGDDVYYADEQSDDQPMAKARQVVTSEEASRPNPAAGRQTV